LAIIDPENTDDVTRHKVYADQSYSGEFTEQQLRDIFAEIGQDIIHKDDTVITMDETEKFTSLVVDGKMQYYDENGELINYELDEAEGDVTVNVTAAIVVPTGVTDASGNIIRKPVTDAHGNIQRCKKVTKTYTIHLTLIFIYYFCRQYRIFYFYDKQIIYFVAPHLPVSSGNITDSCCHNWKR
jgi:hypothetical protein